MVYDGSAEFEQQSVNVEIFAGPDLLVPLFDVITRFRMGKYAIIADLKECSFLLNNMISFVFCGMQKTISTVN